MDDNQWVTALVSGYNRGLAVADGAERGYCVATTLRGGRCGRAVPGPRSLMVDWLPLCFQHEKWLRDELLGLRELLRAELAKEFEERTEVYFVRRADGCIKIGFSKQVEQRVSSLRSKHGLLEVLLRIPGGRETEGRLHRAFHFARRDGEWFALTTVLCDYIDDVLAGGCPVTGLNRIGCQVF